MKHFVSACLLSLAFVISTNAGISVNGYFDKVKDGARFKTLFLENLASKDLSSVYYATKGLKYLGETIPNTANVCQNLKTLSQGSLNVEQCHYASGAVEALQCKPDTLKPEVLKTAVQALDNQKASLTDLLYAVLTLKALGNKGHDTETAVKSLKDFLKKDDSIANLGLVFQICAEVGCQEWARGRIEDALAQADQVGAEGGTTGALLNWEGGLSNTAIVLTGILKLQSTTPTSSITADQSVKLANYLLSRRSVQSVKGAAVLVDAINQLASDKKVSPVCITLSGSGQVSSDSEPIYVSVSDLLGRPHPSISPESVVAQSATRLQDDVVVLSKQKLSTHPKEKTLYVLDLMKVKPERGLYKLALSAGTSSSTLPIRVLGAIEIESVEVGIGDVDGSSGAKLNAIAHPKKLSPTLEADSMQKVILKFLLREKGQVGIAKVHQAFVRLYSTNPDHEVLFVAETEASKAYRMDLDVGAVAENFKHASGLYNIELIIGDSAISNPFRWTLASVNLKFASVQAHKVASIERVAKPEIVHMFREPEVRPPRLVSDIFTALCAAPLLLLFILWGKIGINVRNFPFSLSALGFHGGFGAILGLFIVFWLRLTMFETVRYLLVIGLVTFICGHQLLADVGAKRKRAA